MVVTLSQRFEIALSDPGKSRFSGCKYCACLITATSNGRLSQQRHKIKDIDFENHYFQKWEEANHLEAILLLFLPQSNLMVHLFLSFPHQYLKVLLGALIRAGHQ